MQSRTGALHGIAGQRGITCGWKMSIIHLKADWEYKHRKTSRKRRISGCKNAVIMDGVQGARSGGIVEGDGWRVRRSSEDCPGADLIPGSCIYITIGVEVEHRAEGSPHCEAYFPRCNVDGHGGIIIRS